MKEKYLELSIDRFTSDFKLILERDDMAPLTVTTSDELHTLIEQNDLMPPTPPSSEGDEAKDDEGMVHDESLPLCPLFSALHSFTVSTTAGPTLPQSFEFSRVVPLTYRLIKRFLGSFCVFASELADNDEYMKRGVDLLMKQVWNRTFTTRLRLTTFLE